MRINFSMYKHAYMHWYSFFWGFETEIDKYVWDSCLSVKLIQVDFLFKVTVNFSGFFKIMRFNQELPGLHLTQGNASLGNIIKHVVYLTVFDLMVEFSMFFFFLHTYKHFFIFLYFFYFYFIWHIILLIARGRCRVVTFGNLVSYCIFSCNFLHYIISQPPEMSLNTLNNCSCCSLQYALLFISVPFLMEII